MNKEKENNKLYLFYNIDKDMKGEMFAECPKCHKNTPTPSSCIKNEIGNTALPCNICGKN